LTDLLSQEQTQDHSLPDGWKTASLQELSEINPRFGKYELPEDLEVTFLPMKCVEELSGRIDVSNSKQVCEVRRGYTPFQEEDVIFAKITPCMENGKMAVARSLKNRMGSAPASSMLFDRTSLYPEISFSTSWCEAISVKRQKGI
jgi:hypothetical protein